MIQIHWQFLLLCLLDYFPLICPSYGTLKCEKRRELIVHLELWLLFQTRRKGGNYRVTWAKHISQSSSDTCEEKEVFKGKTRENIIFSEVFGVKEHPLNVLLLTTEYTQWKLVCLFKGGESPYYRTMFTLFIPHPQGPPLGGAAFGWMDPRTNEPMELHVGPLAGSLDLSHIASGFAPMT